MKIREYEIIDKIGEPGGMAVVYKARHQSLEVIRAIKKLHFHLTSNASIIQRFENEAKALSILEHPNIVKVYDFFREEDSYYLIMEYVDGLSLAEVLANSALGEKLALEYIKQILSTMAFAHSKKILHRDIKPSNILIDSKGNVKVVDFGIAKMMDRKGLTSAGFTMGSPWYMSPEQIEGHELDERSDIYSLGITLFEMLTAKVPFNDTSEYKIYEKHQKEPIPSLKETNKKLSPDLDAIIQKASAKDMNDRFQKAEDFAEAVDIYLALSQISKGAGTTIAEFDPSEYVKSEESKELPKIDLDLPTKFMQLTTIGPVQEPAAKKTKVKETKQEQDLKKTTIQKATVFEDTGEETEPQPISDLIDKKKIPGLPSTKKKLLSTKNLFAFGSALIIIVFILFYIFSKIEIDELSINLDKISYSSVQITWPDLTDSEYYQISKKTGSGKDYQLLTKSSSVVFRDSSVIPGEKYMYQVTAHEGGGEIIAIGELSIQTPSIEFGLAADDTSDTSISLFWNQLENVHNYVLYRRDLDSKSPEELKEIYRGNETDYYDNKLKPEKRHSYMLRVEFADQQVFESSAFDIKTKEKTKSAIAFGELRINSIPEGATIFMNGQEIGKTPLMRKGLKTGSYKISLKKEGFSDYSSKVRISANRRTSISPEMVSLTGELAVLVKPFGSILIDGKLLKRDTPTKFTTKLQSGDHKLTVVHAGLGARWEKTIKIDGGKINNITVDFTKMVSLTVTSNLQGTIIVDGKSTGELTPKQIKVRVGQHIIGVRKEGFEMESGSKNINIDNDLNEPLKFTLRERK